MLAREIGVPYCSANFSASAVVIICSNSINIIIPLVKPLIKQAANHFRQIGALYYMFRMVSISYFVMWQVAVYGREGAVTGEDCESIAAGVLLVYNSYWFPLPLGDHHTPTGTNHPGC